MARAAVDAHGLGALLVARPHRDGDLWGIAAEPEVVQVLGGARLAGDGLVDLERVAHRLGGALAAGDDSLERLGGSLGHACVQRLLRVVLVLVDHVAVAVLDLGDGHGVTLEAAAGERGVAGRHVQWRGAHGAQHGGEVGVEVARDAHLLGHGDHVVDADGLRHLQVASIGGDGRGIGEAQIAVLVVAVVLEPRAADGDGRVAVEDDVGVHARLERRGEREDLEARARLALGRGGVHLGGGGAAVVVASAHHRLDVAGRGVDGHECLLQLVVAAVGEELLHGGLGGLLVGGVNRGVDLEAALDDGVGAEVALQHALHVVGPVGVGALLVQVGVTKVELDGLGLGGVVVLLGDVAQAQHVVQDLVAALEAGAGVHGRVVVGGRVGQADERGGLGQREVARVLVEVGLACGLDAVGAVAVVDGVEVHHQDLVLGVHLLHLDGDVGLAHLALEGLVELLVGQDGVAHELLGDGGGALGAAGELREHGAHDACRVDAVVLVEALVLNVHGALEHVVGHMVLRDGLAVLQVERGDGVALRVVDLARLGHQVGVGRGVVRKVLQPRLDERAQ